jgi:hypothetical protein
MSNADVSKSSGKTVYAAVAWSSIGQFLGASSVVVMGMSDPETLEAMAVKEGLALASDLTLQRFRFRSASDNAEVVKSIFGSASGHYGQIVQEIKARATAFVITKFAHEERLSNGDVHRVARGSLFDEVARHL